MLRERLIQVEAMMRDAVRHFWSTRNATAKAQQVRGSADQDNRASVTAGKNLDGFCESAKRVIIDNGIDDAAGFTTGRAELAIPGYFRPTRNWDLLVGRRGVLIAAIEFKSQVGPSFGNNFSNRVEEAVGSATDLWTAYREGAFPTTPKPWLGYLMLLVECEESTRPVSVREPHFTVFPEFKGASYADRYRILLDKLMRERLYDATCFLMTPREAVQTGEYHEPDPAPSEWRL